MDCPRCKLPLTKVDYEGVETDMCSTCWGFWLDRGELGQILEKQDYEFSDDEKQQVLDVFRASKGGTTEPAACPKCGAIMERNRFDESFHIVIDRCPDHGVWLDTGEIKKVQALADDSKRVHQLLLRKLKVLS